MTFRAVGADATSATSKEAQKGGHEAPEAKYEVTPIREDLCAISYLSAAGYTLTAVLDFKTKKLIGFSSNEKMLAVQHGTFEERPS